VQHQAFGGFHLQGGFAGCEAPGEREAVAAFA
jgi:hypothetical protein